MHAVFVPPTPQPASCPPAHDGLVANRVPEVGRAESAIHILRSHKVPRSMPLLRAIVARCLRFDRQAARA